MIYILKEENQLYSESELIEKLLKIEALHAGATSDGEKEAAKNDLYPKNGTLEKGTIDDE
jgi:hypothetical protein